VFIDPLSLLHTNQSYTDTFNATRGIAKSTHEWALEARHSMMHLVDGAWAAVTENVRLVCT
jgi:hypothetical protein